MPSSYTPQQKRAITQFASFTSTKDSVAAKDMMEGVDQDENSDEESDEESDEKMEEVDPDERKR
ncbi:hypothetical protein ABVK25_007607 [Lepraria finkii]|uniref:Uncharacterized protein n=1 Tax=Lepraria finkii TaxID=1340010 RepID=A0ABR4B360_9LECA